jgi:hypothetical protein
MAGVGIFRTGYVGDGRKALATELNYPSHLACDRLGNLFFTEQNNALRVVTAQGVILSVIGGNRSGYIANNGDGGPASQAVLVSVGGLAIDARGRLLIVSSGDVRCIDDKGIISTLIRGSPYLRRWSQPVMDATQVSLTVRRVVPEPDGSLVVATSDQIVRFTPDGKARLLAGIQQIVDDAGGGDGTFEDLTGLCADGHGGFFVIDGPLIRHVTPPDKR